MTPFWASGSAETLPGSAMGTPAYMSPEQARGEIDQLGPRSDVYSLGATLYCLLTGEPPIQSEDLQSDPPRRPEGRLPAAATARSRDRKAPRGGLPEGHGTRPGRSLRLAPCTGR